MSSYGISNQEVGGLQAQQIADLLKRVEILERLIGGGLETLKVSFSRSGSASPTGTIVAASAGQIIRVHAIALMAGGNALGGFYSNNVTPITELFQVPEFGGMVWPEASGGWCDTIVSQALNWWTTTSFAGGPVRGQIAYTFVDV
jgi:hypothetical protein